MPWLAIEVLLEGRRGPSEAKAKLPSELRNTNLAEKTCILHATLFVQADIVRLIHISMIIYDDKLESDWI